MTDDASFRLGFRQFARALNLSHKGRYFLADGTLLGFVRENDFIGGDPDIDIGMFAEDYDNSVIDCALRAGFVLLSQAGTIDDGLRLQFHNGKVPIDLNLYYATPQGRHTCVYQRHNRVRYSHVDFKLEPAVFHGMSIMIPSNPEEMLRAQYGPSWRKPTTCWSYAFSPDNAAPDGGLLWRGYFAWRRAGWNLRRMAQTAGLLTTPVQCPDLPPVQQRENIVDSGIIFTDGVFDVMHENHVKVLENAKQMGEYLVVAVISDALASSYKRKPVICEQERLFMVQSLACVDEAYILSGPLDAGHMQQILAKYQPRHVVYGGDVTPEFYTPAEQSGIMIRPAYRKGVSSSAIIDTILSRTDLKTHQ